MYMLRCVCVCVCVCVFVCVCMPRYRCVFVYLSTCCYLLQIGPFSCMYMPFVTCLFFLIIIFKNFNLLLPFWGRKDLSYWVKLLTFPAHVSVQSFIAEEENGGHTSVHISNSQPVRSNRSGHIQEDQQQQDRQRDPMLEHQFSNEGTC